MFLKKKLLLATVLLLVLGGAFAVYSLGVLDVEDEEDIAVNSFEECVEAGYVVMETFPPQCRTPDGETFVQDIGNVLEMENEIRIETPRPNEGVSSPLLVRGEARGTWFFEGDFPVYIYDHEGNELGSVPAMAQGEWMTEDFVPYEAELEFETPATEKGLLVLRQDDPRSPEERGDDEVKELYVPVVFDTHNANGSARANDGCVITGCSGEICADQEMASTCEYRPEYACYADATCERQAGGECGWTQTTELSQCLRERG